MTILHLRKTNSPDCNPQVVDWFCTFDDKTNICTHCTTIDGKESPAFVGRTRSFIDRWLRIGKVGEASYHEIVEEHSTK